MYFSIVIPVYNRPQEVQELLQSMTQQSYSKTFEVVIVEDGSANTCETIVESFKEKLDIQYFLTENQGAGQSRNYGMRQAKGAYFIVLDSDVLLPKDYLKNIELALDQNYTDAFGGPDAAHESFTLLQKAINYSMTSVFTTGGIRGKKKSVGKFQPRSFNLGISKKAFEVTQGFSKMKYGEDIDLSFRLWENGFETQLIPSGYVYHKRRSTIKEFYRQTFNFGTARPYLNRKYPDTKKLTYWFPSLFIIGFDIAIVLSIFIHPIFLLPFIFYFIALTIDSTIQNKSIIVGLLSIVTTYTQFMGYGLGFLKAFLKLK